MKVLKYHVRESDIVSRWGGEEFVILLPKTKSDGAFIIAEKLREAVEMLEVALEDGSSVYFTISAGVSDIDYSENESLELAISRADKALYDAKKNGRNVVKIFQ